MEILYTQRKGFQDFRTPESQQWLDDESDTERAERLGWIRYYSTNSWAAHAWETIDVWITKDPAHPMVAALCFGDSTAEVWFPSKPDFLHYWHQFAAARIALLSSQIHQLHETAAKTFQVQHGHSAADSCRVCKPSMRKPDQRGRQLRAAAAAMGWSPSTESLDAFLKRHGMLE